MPVKFWENVEKIFWCFFIFEQHWEEEQFYFHFLKNKQQLSLILEEKKKKVKIYENKSTKRFGEFRKAPCGERPKIRSKSYSNFNISSNRWKPFSKGWSVLLFNSSIIFSTEKRTECISRQKLDKESNIEQKKKKSRGNCCDFGILSTWAREWQQLDLS